MIVMRVRKGMYKMKKLGVGILGAGGIARTRMIPGILKSEKVELTAIMGPHQETLDRVKKGMLAGGFSKEQVEAVKTYLSAEDLMKDPSVDLVYIASPVQFHLEQTRLAATYGKHVLSEKPLARTVAEAEEMVRLLREKNLKAGCAFMMRFHTYHRQLKDLVASGAFGQIVSGRCQQVFVYPPMEGAWRQVKALGGGGALMDVGVHNIDLMEFILGSPVKDAKGFVETRTFSYDSDDSCELLLKMENGAVVYIDGAFNRYAPPGGGLLELYGTKGTALLQGSVGQVEGGTYSVRVLDENGVFKTIDLEKDFGDLYTKEIDAFADAILQNTPEPVPMEQGLHIQKIAAWFEE